MLTPNAQSIFEKRIAKPGDIKETWEEACSRVAEKVASAEECEDIKIGWKKSFNKMLLNLDFLPNSPTLRNFGVNNGSGSACFVLPIEDSRRGIFKTLADAVDVQAFGGGTGFNFSRLRPVGTAISSTGGKASGPISFMTIFDHTIGDIIKQGGTRDGANMGILRVDHPDILKFMEAKHKEGILKNFNLSVGITDAFMLAVEDDKPFDLVFNGKIYETVPARMIWGKIVEGAWNNGEPGVVFLDTINKKNPLAPVGEIEATNPCGEQPLLPYSSCNLGAINLSRIVKGDWVKGEAILDWTKLSITIRCAVRFLDNVISVNSYPIAEIEEMSKKTRQIGLGIMGFADLCIKLHIRYGSPESIDLAKQVMQRIYKEAQTASEELAMEKSVAPIFEEYSGFGFAPRRNGALTTIAPTGTISMLANCSSGCEPHFKLDYVKECCEGKKFSMIPEVVKEWVEVYGDTKLPEFFTTSNQVTVDEHVDILAAFQNAGIDSAVSKTINAPNETTREMVSNAFKKAWNAGCKGLTFYRDGSRDTQVLYSTDSKQAKQPAKATTLQRGEIKERGRATSGPSFKIKTACGQLYIDPHFDPEELLEVFIRAQGGCEANSEALGRVISLAKRGGISEMRIARTLQSVNCRACNTSKNTEAKSCAAAIGKAIELSLLHKEAHMASAKAIEDINQYFNGNGKAPKGNNKCPICGVDVYMESGCRTCPECGWSKCG